MAMQDVETRSFPLLCYPKRLHGKLNELEHCKFQSENKSLNCYHVLILQLRMLLVIASGESLLDSLIEEFILLLAG